jgi:starch synthase (maltosyl-transferring)
LSRPDSLAPFISAVNAIRHANAALQSDWSLIFHTVDNSELLCYSKRVADNCIVVVANLDTRYAQSGWVTLDLDALDLASGTPYEMHDLLSGARYQWHGMRNFVRLDPALTPAHIFRVLGEPRPAAATSLTV